MARSLRGFWVGVEYIKPLKKYLAWGWVSEQSGVSLNVLMHSRDAKSWAASPTPTEIAAATSKQAFNAGSVKYVPPLGKAVAISADGFIYHSSDLETWTYKGKIQSLDGNVRSVLVSNSGVIVVVTHASATGLNFLYSSADGVNFTPRLQVPNSNFYYQDANEWCGDSIGFVVSRIGYDNGGTRVNCTYTSLDGFAWTLNLDTGGQGNRTSMAWSETIKKIAAVGQSYDGFAQARLSNQYSGNGKTWSAQIPTPVGNWRGAKWFDGAIAQYMAVSDDRAGAYEGGIMKSADAVDWNKVDIPQPANTKWYAMCHNPDEELLVLIGSNTVDLTPDNIRFSGDGGNSWGENVPSVAVTDVELMPSTVTLESTQTQQLTPIFTPPDATDKTVFYSSSDSEVATVNSTGLVTGIAEGTATITVITHDGNFTATCEVTVGNAPPVHRLMYIIKL